MLENHFLFLVLYILASREKFETSAFRQLCGGVPRYTWVLTSPYPNQDGNKLCLSKVGWAEEWIDLARVGTGGGLL